MNRLPCPVIIRGTLYPSQSAAARALGVAQAVVFRALDRGTADNVGLGRSKPVTIDGTEYPSVTAAAAALGRAKSTISKRLRRAA